MKNSVGEVGNVSGLGNVSLLGAFAGAASFSSSYANGSPVSIRIDEMDSDGLRGFPVAWEICRGVWYSSGNTITRGAVLASSNSGAQVNFGLGLKRICVVLPAEDVGGAPGGSSGQAQYNYGGVLGGAQNEVYDSATGGLKFSKSTYTPTTTTPGELVKTIAEHGSYSGIESTFSLHHAYHPTATVDLWSLVAKSGSVGGQSAVLSFGNNYESYNVELKNMGLVFRDCGVAVNQLSVNRLELRTANPTSSQIIIGDGSTETGFLYSGNLGLWVFANYQSTELFRTSKNIGGTRISGYTASSVPLTVQLAASQTGDAWQVKDSANAVVAKCAANGDLTARSLLTSVFTVATLPSGLVSQRAFVVDEMSGAFGSMAMGGGTLERPVFFGNGQWRVG